MNTPRVLVLVALLASVLCAGCSKQAGGASEGGIADGPASIAIPANLGELIAKATPAQGEALFNSKGCKACHNRTDVKLVGPGLTGVSARRSVNWMAKMILKPEIMVKEDAEAKKLFAAMMTQMANQNVAPEAELPALIAFLKTL